MPLHILVPEKQVLRLHDPVNVRILHVLFGRIIVILFAVLHL